MSYYKKFKQSLHDEYDGPAKIAVGEFLGARGYFCTFPETKSNKKADISVLRPQEHEVQVSIHWKNDEFPYQEIHVYERKKHLFETELPLWLWVLNTTRTKAYVIEKSKFTKERMKPIFSAYLTKERGKDTYENRYCIPKEEATLINLKDRYCIPKNEATLINLKEANK